MIRDRNIKTDANFARETVLLDVTAGASQAGVRITGWRAPYAGVIVSAHVYCATITDADDSVRVDLHKNAASVLGATVDPVAADTATALNVTTTSFAAGDVLKSVVTTGVGDALAGAITLVVRPELGVEALS
ncbi:MAG TPA: hypothetical protein VGK73_32375 [Polyangiaceae bacterium]